MIWPDYWGSAASSPMLNTGYGASGLPEDLAACPVLAKPFTLDGLDAKIRDCVKAGAARSSLSASGWMRSLRADARAASPASGDLSARRGSVRGMRSRRAQPR